MLQKNNDINAAQMREEKDRQVPDLMREVAKIMDSEKAGKIKQQGT